jgi:hypothetical protein
MEYLELPPSLAYSREIDKEQVLQALEQRISKVSPNRH